MELVIKTAAEDILAGLQVDEATVRVERLAQSEEEELEQYLVEISTTDAPLLIGRHGDNLQAFQHILKLMVGKKSQELNRRITILVDIDGYLKRKQEEAVELAVRRAQQVRSSGNSIKLPPMSGYLRRLIHMEFTKPEWEDVTTESTGERGYRAVVLKKA
jgi:spoIIIJ-associated protein